MNRIFQVSLLAVLAIILSSCNSTVVQSLGNTVEESRDVSGFDKVVIVGSGNLSLAQTGTETLIVEADEAIMQYITTEVRGSTLILEYDPPNNSPNLFGQPINYTLTLDELVGLEISGSGKIVTEPITTHSLEMEISGSGEIQISGTATEQNIQIDGNGKVDAEDLSGDSGIVSISGSGNASVWLSSSLDVTISGSGTVDYYGDPSTSLSISGSGEINNLGSK